MGDRVRKATIGDTRDLRLDVARKDALKALERMRETGMSPAEARELGQDDIRVADMTVADCFALYKGYLATKSPPAKDSSLRGIDQALRRLRRPEINLAESTIRSLMSETKIMKAFDTLATSRRQMPSDKERRNDATDVFDRPTRTSAKQTFRRAIRSVN